MQDCPTIELCAWETVLPRTPPRIEDTSPERLPKEQTGEILYKPMEEQNPRLTTGSSPVHQRFIIGTRSVLCSWLPTSGTTPFCLCKPCTCRIQNPDIPRAGRVGALGGAAGQGRARLGANRIIRPVKKVYRTPQGIEKTSLQRLSRSTNKRIPM